MTISPIKPKIGKAEIAGKTYVVRRQDDPKREGESVYYVKMDGKNLTVDSSHPYYANLKERYTGK